MEEVYTSEKVHEIVEKQRKFFKTGATLPVKYRIEQLKKLKKAVKFYEEKMTYALFKDLGRCKEEAYLCDVGTVIAEINESINGLRFFGWARPELHFSGLMCFPSIFTKVYKMPYGVSLIISPFNFPFLLSLGVLIASIAGGNTSVIKASSKSKYCTEVLKEMIKETFDESYVTVIDGGHDVADFCLNERFDKIFYTGSPRVGKHVMECASKNLTPVALELGGETGNWCIVRKDADLKDAARKIAFIKGCNSGQICININQVAVAKEVSDQFVEELKAAFTSQFGEKISNNNEYSGLINESAFNNCMNEMEQYKDRVVFGGDSDINQYKISPTIIYPVDINESIVQHELFNPLLPIVPYEDERVDELLDVIADREHGLALYVFTKDMKWANKVMSTQQYGGGCINEVCVHMLVKGVPFNGTGHSGMGAYHGIWGFREFTHPTTVLKGHTKCNLPLREHPYKKKRKFKILKIFEK